MDKLIPLSYFFAGMGIFLGAIGFLWWCSIYERIHFHKKDQEEK